MVVPAIERQWQRGRAATLVGGGLLAAGYIAYLSAGGIALHPAGSVRVLSLWPFAVMWLGAMAAGFAQMYL